MPSKLAMCLLAVLLAGCASSQGTVETGYVVTVHAGELGRQGTPVSFALPPELAGSEWQLVDEAGTMVPGQAAGDGQIVVVVDDLPAGASREYRLVRGDGAGGRITAQPESGAVTFAIDGAPVLRYNADETELPDADIDSVFRRGGYIHPVYTPTGKDVTGDYPANHRHHHGIWAAWTNTVFEGRTPDFWNMGQRRGTVRPVSLDTVWSGPVHAGFAARHAYIDLTAEAPREALHESWTARVYDPRAEAPRYRLFDLEVRHETASSSPLTLPEYHYGGVGFRGRDEWDGAENAFFLTSEGRDRSNGHATRARWVHIGGHVDGELVGVAILAHPANFRFPEPMRIHPTEPFFNWAPSQGGEWSIEPGRPFVARYRYVVADGGPDVDQIERLWNDFAHPPEATVSRR